MAKDKISLPMSQGGLRTFSEGQGFSKLTFAPDKFIFVSILLAVLLILVIKANPLGF